MKKKVLSIVLSMLMVLSFMPAGTFAEDGTADTSVNVTADETNDNVTADETDDADNTVDAAETTGESEGTADNSAKEQQAASITIKITLPEGLNAKGMDEDTRLVTRVAGENGEIDPIVISCEDEGAFSTKLASAININSSFQESGLSAAYSAKSDTLTISGSPTKSIKLDMDEILTAAMEDIGAYDVETTTDECIKIGSNTYASLEAAVAAANDGDTLWLIGDDAAVQKVTIDKSLTIELHGHKLSSTALKVTGSSTNVTINDRVGTGSINTDHAAGFSTDHNRCTATIVVGDLATLTINGVTGTSKDNGTIISDCANDDLEKAIFVQGASKLVINGGTFVAQQSAGCDALYVYDGTVTINAGYFFMNLSYQTAPSTAKPLTIKKCEIYNPSASGAIWIQNSGTINGVTFGSGFQSLESIKKLFLSTAAGNYIIDGSTANHVKIACGLYVSTEVSSTTLADGTLYCVGQASETSPEQITPSEGAKITLAPQIAGGDGTTITYQWEKDGSTLSDATGATYTIDNYKGSDDGTYKVTATEGGSSVSLYYQIGDTNEHKHCVCGVTDCTDTANHGESITWQPWTSENSLPSEAGNYYLLNNVTLSSRWAVSANINLCLNGQTITGASGASVITVNGDASLTITDCQTTAGKITHNSGENGRGIYNSGTFTMYGGYITNNSAEYNGGGVFNNSGTFTMYGGYITNNSAGSYDGGGVYNISTFSMHGGHITQNSSGDGGGVYNQKSAFNMTGGSITDNVATSYWGGEGGGMYNYQSTFNMTGGSIINNIAKGDNRLGYGSGVYNYQSTFNMSAGSITGNKATGEGGGVYNYSGSLTMSDAPIIADNNSKCTLGSDGTLTGGSADNLKLVGAAGGWPPPAISLKDSKPLTDGAKVGLTSVVDKTIVYGSTDTTGFFSDNTDYDLVANSDNTGLKLAGHSWSTQWTKNDTHHWHICTNDGCEGNKDYAEHSYDRTVPSNEYLKTDATCTAKAVYYKSCVCGKAGTETFESGEMAKHSYGDLIPKKEATCIEAGMNAYYQCSVCNKYFDEAKAETTLDNLIISVDRNNHDLKHHDAKSATCTEKGWKAYDTCKRTGCEYTTYEEISAPGHDMTEVSGQAATTSADGNIKYWYCNSCGKYFGDEDGNYEITEADTIIKKLPLIIKGDNAKLTHGMKQALSFTSDAEFTDFIRVDLDGATLDAKYYTVESGSTIVTLNADYVATLAIGEHTLDIVSQNGTATAKFTVNKKAAEEADTKDKTVTDAAGNTAGKSTGGDNTKSSQTGDNSNIALWLTIVLASGGAVTVTRLTGRRRKYNR